MSTGTTRAPMLIVVLMSRPDEIQAGARLRLSAARAWCHRRTINDKLGRMPHPPSLFRRAEKIPGEVRPAHSPFGVPVASPFGDHSGSGPGPPGASGSRIVSRSEEHTSELQSLMRISYAVFCLKKK